MLIVRHIWPHFSYTFISLTVELVQLYFFDFEATKKTFPSFKCLLFLRPSGESISLLV